MPQISIIVPVYKVEPYLCRCVDSILAQTFQDFELILVDDGSPDNCPAICDEYAKTDSRIHVIHKENGGLSSARNAGLHMAVGQYIMFCDSDDTVDPQWCEILYNAIIVDSTAWAFSNMWKVDCNGRKTLCGEFIDSPSGKQNISYFRAYQMGLSGFSVNKIYNLNILRKNNIYFDEDCIYAEDVEFNVKYYLLCNQALHIDTPLYFYYDNSEGITKRYYPELFALRIPQFTARLAAISPLDLEPFCDNWLYIFIRLFENVFDDQNPMSFFEKMHFNQKMIQRDDVQFCLKHSSGKNENPLVIRILKTKNYYLYWLFQKTVQIKNFILSKTQHNGT